jgi:hypothetical protein
MARPAPGSVLPRHALSQSENLLAPRFGGRRLALPIVLAVLPR